MEGHIKGSKVVRKQVEHDNVPEDTEGQFGAQVGKGGDKLVLEPLQVEDTSAQTGTSGDEAKVAEAIGALQRWR
jgi:hypothetical protein